VNGAVAVSGWKKLSTADAAASCDALMIRIAGGDEVAFAELYDGICSQLLGLVQRFRIDQMQAEEALRLIFLEIWRTAPLFDATDTSAAAWILHLAHCHAVERG
jgi:RNA polymerase sigma-70 factor (ECF subfamily)